MSHTNHLRLLSAAGLLGSSVALAHPGHESAPELDPAQYAAASAQPGPPRGAPGEPGVNGRPEPMKAIELPAPMVSITIEGEYRVIRANGLPAHETGTFPNKDNPNALRPQNHEYKIPLKPTRGAEPIMARPEFGIAINGVVFDVGTGEFWTAEQSRTFGGGSPWNYEALGGGVPLGLDRNNAHVQPTGKYHYHGLPTGLIESLAGEQGVERMMLLGWAFDGFPIYGPWGYSDPDDPNSELKELRTSYRLKPGDRPEPPEGPGGAYDGTFGLDYEYVEGLGDLDECNGRFGVTPEFPEGTYYYVMSEKFPQVPALWRGVPDASIRQRGPGGGPDERPGPVRRNGRRPARPGV